LKLSTILLPIIVCFLFAAIITSCKKEPDNPTTTSNFSVDNKWECRIDGIDYSGTIDTSFIQITNVTNPHPDTIFECSGTNYGKNANIRLKFVINRALSASSQNVLVIFDTASTNILAATNVNFGLTNVTCNIDTLIQSKLKATFSGDLLQMQDGYNVSSTLHTVTNGKFSCEFGLGNAAPKSYSFTSNGTDYSGYFPSGKITSNCLIMDGFPISNITQKFKLMVRTGSGLKTGIYESKNGDVGLQFYSPSIYPFYINDTSGNLTVNINYVNGNIVAGSFFGTNDDGKTISNGKFSCRVKNYTDQKDSLNKWAFSEDESIFLYNIYGGNITSAVKSQTANKYFLTINGESDDNTSVFKLMISSKSPIAKGVYQAQYSDNKLDSINFLSNAKIWNGNTTKLYIDEYTTAFCSIDSIDSHRVYGTLYGRINIYINANGISGADMKKGRFQAAF
jgi:hypothetical protein